MAQNEKAKALELALQKIEKDFGKEAVLKLGDQARKNNVEAIPTGSLALDLALGVGGLPRGRVIEIYGPEASGKTTLALHAVANVQKAGGQAAYIDAEHAMDPVYAKKLGVNLESLLISQPDSGEQALEITETLTRSGALDIIVIDSVAALVPRAEIEGEMGAQHMGLQARLMSQALRKLTGTLSKTKTTIVFINQLRHKIGVFMGNPETTTGGMALKFYASVRLDIRRIETLKVGDVPVGSKVRVKVVKNKVSSPYRQAEFEMIYGEGISREGSAIDMGVQYNVLTKSGSWYLLKDKQLGQGREQTRNFFKENPAVLEQVEQEILKGALGEPVETKETKQQVATGDSPGRAASETKKAKKLETAKA